MASGRKSYQVPIEKGGQHSNWQRVCAATSFSYRRYGCSIDEHDDNSEESCCRIEQEVITANG